MPGRITETRRDGTVGRRSVRGRARAAAITAFLLLIAACGSGDATLIPRTSTTPSTVTTTPPTVTTTPPTVTNAPPNGFAQLTVEEGAVSVNGSEIGAGDTEVVRLNEQVVAGEGARGVLRLEGGLEFVLFKGTNMTLERTDPPEIVAFLNGGHLRASIEPGSDARLRLETANAILTTLEDGTDYTVCQASTGLTCLDVSAGQVEWDTQGQITIHRARESAFAELGVVPEIRKCIPRDAADRWLEGALANQDDRPLAALVRTYLPCLPSVQFEVFEAGHDETNRYHVEVARSLAMMYTLAGGDYGDGTFETVADIAFTAVENPFENGDYMLGRELGTFRYGLVFRAVADREFLVFHVQPAEECKCIGWTFRRWDVNTLPDVLDPAEAGFFPLDDRTYRRQLAGSVLEGRRAELRPGFENLGEGVLPRPDLGEPVRLTVIATGNTFELLVDGDTVATVTVPESPASGDNGVYVETLGGEELAHIVFESITAVQPG